MEQLDEIGVEGINGRLSDEEGVNSMSLMVIL